MKILVTGANGFVGSAISDALQLMGHQVVRQVRENPMSGQTVLGEINRNTDWSSLLVGCHAVFHLAAIVPEMRSAAPLPILREVNTAGTVNLALQAAAHGVKRFIFLSSVKVCGEQTKPGRPFLHDDTPAPKDAYGVSKLEAELGLCRVATEAAMEVVIVRSPLVYGPRVKGNFAAMMEVVRGGRVLPLGGITNNRRSFVALDNLVDLLITCLDHSSAANQIFLVSDDDDLSTTDLLCRLGVVLGRSPRLLPVPPKFLHFGGRVLGKGDMVQRLLGNLQVDIAHTKTTLGWNPPIGVNEGLRRVVRALEK